MKSLKRTLVLLVVLSMIFSTFVPAFAATDVADLDCEDAVLRMEALDIIAGFEDGTFRPEETITRAQMAVIICKMTGIDAVTVEENAVVPSKFSDVKAGDWYTGYVNVAAGRGLLSGFPDGTFRPAEVLTMNQVLTLCVNALGRGEYVSEMGTWPANYIAEATKLGLLDGVKTSAANRGNVAMIAWNTLEAPAVWDVTGTEYSDGSINLSNSKASLLSIYFRKFTTEEGLLKEIEVLPAKVVALDEDFIEVSDTAFTEFVPTNSTLKKEFNFRTKASDDETYYAGNTVYAYVPDEVMEDLDELKNREFTMILGEDNEVVAIIVEDDVIETAFLTDYDATNHKITVDGETYKLLMNGANEDVKVTVNYAEKDGAVTPANWTLTSALTAILGGSDFEDIEKKIEATLTLDNKDRVTAVDLLVSTNATNVKNTVETLVLEVKEGKDKYTLHLANGSKIVVEDDFEKLPKVYVDGVKGDLSDIEAGNVLTIITDANSTNEVKLGNAIISRVYVSTETAVGEPERVRKSDNQIYVDGTGYARSVANTTGIVYEDELEKDVTAKDLTSADMIMDNDEITLYLNMFGEYVAVSLEDASSSDYQFGVVTYVNADVNYEGDDGEIETMTIKLLAQNATKSVRYTVNADTSDDDIAEGELYSKLTAGSGIENKLVMFIADADRNIDMEDLYVIDTTFLSGTIPTELKDYVFVEGTGVAATDLDADGEFTIAKKKITVLKDASANEKEEYRYSSANTTIFNLGGEDAGKCGATTATDHVAGCTNNGTAIASGCTVLNRDIEAEVITDWSDIVNIGGTAFTQSAIVIGKVDGDAPLCIALVLDEATESDLEYAVVTEEIYVGKEDATAILLAEGNETELKANKVAVEKVVKGAFINFKTKSDAIFTANVLVDIVEFGKLLAKGDQVVANTVVSTADGSSTLAESYEVSEILFDNDTDEYEIAYVKVERNLVDLDNTTADDDEEDYTADTIYVEDDEVKAVYDLRDGKCDKTTMDAVKAEVENGAEIYLMEVTGGTTDCIFVVLGNF